MMEQEKKTVEGMKSVHQQMKIGIEEKTLAICSDKEWEESESAYSAALLNVKKKSNRVTVFAAPEKIADAMTARVPSVFQEIPVLFDKDERVKGLARLITGVAKMLLDDDSSVGVEVTVSMKLNRDAKQQNIQ